MTAPVNAQAVIDAATPLGMALTAQRRLGVTGLPDPLVSLRITELAGGLADICNRSGVRQVAGKPLPDGVPDEVANVDVVMAALCDLTQQDAPNETQAVRDATNHILDAILSVYAKPHPPN